MSVIQARLFILPVLFLFLALPGWLWAAPVIPGDSSAEPVDLEADQIAFDDQAGHYLASGNVRLNRGELQLQCDELWWHRDSGEVEATGGVVLESVQERLTGQRLSYNLNEETGFVEDGQVFLREQNLHISGTRIEKRGESDYRVVDGTFTTCDGDVPSWKFGAQQLDVTIGGYARARHAVFYLKDIPSFYVPYMIYPAKTERESGLLMPRFGYSDRRGMEYSDAYYQVISRNQDATFFLDFLSTLGIGKGLEYRYIFGRDNAGEAHGYHIDAKEGEDRYALAWEHQGTLPSRIRLSADTEYVSQRDFFEDFGEEAGEYNKDQSLSVVSLSRNWGRYNLVGQLRYGENLQVDDPTTLQWLPKVSLDSVRQQIGTTPFYFILGSEYTYFWREEGLKGQRLRVRPSLLAALKLWDTIDVAPEVGWTERHYWTSEEGADHAQEGLYDFSTRLSSQFYRVYNWVTGPVSRIRHMVEPEITYRYVPAVDQEALPEFDSFDRIETANQIEYGLTQRFTTRAETGGELPEYRDLLFLRLSQNYDLLHDGEVQAHFSSMRGQLALMLAEFFELDAAGRFDFDRESWDEYSGEGLFHDQRGNRLGLQYRKRKADLNEEGVDYGSLNLDLAWFKPVYLGYRNRYDFTQSVGLEQVLEVEYRHQCWSLFLTLRERENDKSIMFMFSLGGIGRASSAGGNMGGS